MEEGFSLLSTMERIQITTQRLRQGLLQPKDSEFHCSKDFCIQSTSITFLSKSISQHPPQGLYLYGGNKAVSQVEEVEIVKVIKEKGLTNLKLLRVIIFNC